MPYGTRRFNVAFTRAFQKSLSWAESTQFLVLIPISLKSTLILSSHLRLGLPKGIFPAGVPVKVLKALIPSSILAIRPAHLSLLDLITHYCILGERYRQWTSSSWTLLHSSLSSFLGPDIRLSILFSNTLSLRSSRNVRDHTSQPYNTTDNIIGSHKNILPHDKPLAEMSLLTGYQSDCRQQGQLCYRGFQNYEFYLNEDGGDSSQLGYSKDIK